MRTITQVERNTFSAGDRTRTCTPTRTDKKGQSHRNISKQNMFFPDCKKQIEKKPELYCITPTRKFASPGYKILIDKKTMQCPIQTSPPNARRQTLRTEGTDVLRLFS